MRRDIAVVLGALWGLLSACTPGEASFTVTVRADTVPFVTQGLSAAPWIRFELPVTVRNTGEVPLYDAFCAVRVERQAGAAWETVWSPVCAAGSTEIRGLRPGEQRQATYVITSAIGQAGSFWVPPVRGGPYRYVLGLSVLASSPMGPRGGPHFQSSNAFALRDSVP